MKVLSLFSGVGGFDLGLENAGMQTVFQCEWDKHATSILERHWPDTPRWGDITTLTGEHILTHAPVIDVVAWGSPCQDLSVAGKRAGLEGSRSGLFHQGIRIINELRKATNNVYPRISIWENVYGALNSNKGSDFGVILDEMAEAGSLVQEWRVLDAQYFGVPQRRRRVFLISVFDSAIAANCPDPLLPVCEGVRWDSATSRTARQEPAGTVTESFASGSFGGWTETDTAITLSARDHKSSNTISVESFTGTSHAQYAEGVGTLRANGGDLSGGSETIVVEPHHEGARDGKLILEQAIPIQDGRDIEKHQNGIGVAEPGAPSYTIDQTGAQAVAYTMRMREGKPGGGKGPLISEEKSLTLGAATNDQTIFQPNPLLSFDTQFGSNANVFENQSPTLKASQAAPSVMQYDGYNQRIHEDDVSVTLRLGRDSSDFVAQPTEPTMSVRRLTPLECERLMGWPDQWTETKADGTPQADTHRYKQCGNGVASPVAQWIGQQLLNL